MIVYIAMIIISMICLVFAQKTNKKVIKVLLYILATLPFFIVSAFRYDVGTDYIKRYTEDFYVISQGKDVNNLEIGFKLLINFCLNFSKNPNLLFFITSGIITALIMTTIYIKSKNIMLSVLLFFLGGFFFDSMNLVRQYIAIGIIFAAHLLLCKKKNNILNYIGFIVCNVIAVLIHNSSIVGLILLFFNRKMVTSWKWVIPCSILILILNQRLIGIVEIVVQNTRFSNYLTGMWANGEVSILYILENTLVYIFMSYVYYKNKKMNNNDKESTLLINIQATSLIVTVLGTVHMQFARIALYFLVFQIISIPHFIKKIPVEEIKNDICKITRNKINMERFKNKIPVITTTAFILCFMGLFGYTNIKNNNNEVVPYKTIFNHDLEIK